MSIRPIQFAIILRSRIFLKTPMIRSYTETCIMEEIEKRFDKEWIRIERKTYQNEHSMLHGTIRERRYYYEKMKRGEQERKKLDEINKEKSWMKKYMRISVNK